MTAEMPEAKTRALAQLDLDARQAFEQVEVGLAALERLLPTQALTPETDEETRSAIGRVIAKAKRVEKFVESTLADIVAPWTAKVADQRALWNPLRDHARRLYVRAQALVDDLIRAEAAKREAEERAARELVAKKQQEQQAAEAKALAATTTEEQVAASKEAEAAWIATRTAVAALDRSPATTKVQVGDAVVFESSHVDYDIVDMGAFAKAHPELVEVRRGPTLTALRAALRGLTSLPETLAGWPGVRLKMAKRRAGRTTT